MTKAVPRTPPPPPEPETRRYVVLSRRCVWGRKGQTISLALGDKEAALLAAGTLARVEDEPRPTPADLNKKG